MAEQKAPAVESEFQAVWQPDFKGLPLHYLLLKDIAMSHVWTRSRDCKAVGATQYTCYPFFKQISRPFRKI